MEKEEFIEKWRNRNLKKLDSADFVEFSDDVYKLSGEEKTHSPLEVFLATWKWRIEVGYERFERDTRELVAWAANNMIKGAKGDYRVFSEAEKPESDERWVASVATAELRWNMGKWTCVGGRQQRDKVLQQKWVKYPETQELGYPPPEVKWRDVPIENI